MEPKKHFEVRVKYDGWRLYYIEYANYNVFRIWKRIQTWDSVYNKFNDDMNRWWDVRKEYDDACTFAKSIISINNVLEFELPYHVSAQNFYREEMAFNNRSIPDNITRIL
jgi:hypothetical protein